MRVKSKILQKIYACFALICFVSTLAPVPDVFADTGKPAKFPSDLGTLRETFQGSSGKSVILIQDAHANYDAQTSIRKLIDHFQKKSGINFVALEGGSGPLDLALLRAFPDQKTKEFVMDEYVRAGELSGAEMAAVVNVTPSQYVGIEDTKLYEENKKAFFAALKEHEKNKIELLKIRAELEGESLKIDSPELRKLRTRKVEALSDLAKEQKIDIKKFSGLEQIVDALKEKLFQSEAQRALDREFQHFEALERISRLEATREDALFSASFLKEFKIDLKEALKFYDLAFKRDQVFANKLLTLNQSAIFVAGGFHTDGVKAKLKRAGISYQVITPKILTAGSNENYLKVMRGEISYTKPCDLEKEITAVGDDDAKIIMRRKLQEWRMRFSGVPMAALPILDRQLGIATLAPSIQTAAHPQHQQFLDAVSLRFLIRSAQTAKPKITIADVVEKLESVFGRSLGHRPGSDDEINALAHAADAAPNDLSARRSHLLALERASRWFEIYQLILDKKLPRDGNPEFKRLFDVARVGLSSIYDLGNQAGITPGPRLPNSSDFAFTEGGKKILCLNDGWADLCDLRTGIQNGMGDYLVRAISPNGRGALLQSDGQLEVYDFENLKSEAMGFRNEHASIAFSSNGRYLAHVFFRRYPNKYFIRVLDLVTKQIVDSGPYPENSEELKIIDVSNNGDRLILSDRVNGVNHIILWSMENKGNYLKHIDMDVRAIFSPDGRFVVSGNSSRERNLVVWDAKTGEKIGNLEGSQGWYLHAFAFRPGTSEILVGSTLCENEQYIGRIWNLETLKRTKTLPMGSNKITAIAFSPNGEWAAAGDAEGTVHMFRIDGRSEIEESFHFDVRLPVQKIAFNPISSSIAVGAVHHGLRIFHFAPRPGYEAIHQKLFPPVQAPPQSAGGQGASLGHSARPGSEDEIRELGSAADAAPADLTTRIRHLRALERAQRWTEIFQIILEKNLPRDADPEIQRLFLASRRGFSSIYDFGNTAGVHAGLEIPDSMDFTFSDDGRRIAVKRLRGQNVTQFDLNDRREVQRHPAMQGYRWPGNDLSSNGKFAYVEEQVGEPHIYDLERQRNRDEIQLTNRGYNTSRAFSENGRYFAISYAHNKLICVWDLFENRIVYEAKYDSDRIGRNVAILDVSNDGKRLILSCATQASDDFPGNNHILLWNMENGGRQLQHIDLNVNAVFSPDGRFVISDSASHLQSEHKRYLRVWDAKTGEKIGNLDDSLDWNLYVFAFRPVTGELLVGLLPRVHGERFVFGRIWNLETLKKTKDLTTPISGPNQITAAAFSPDGNWAATGDRNGFIRIFSIDGRPEILENSNFFIEDSTITKIAFNPVGSSIAVTRIRGGVEEVRVYHFAPKPGFEAIHQWLYPPGGPSTQAVGASLGLPVQMIRHIATNLVKKGFQSTDLERFIKSTLSEIDDPSRMRTIRAEDNHIRTALMEEKTLRPFLVQGGAKLESILNDVARQMKTVVVDDSQLIRPVEKKPETHRGPPKTKKISASLKKIADLAQEPVPVKQPAEYDAELLPVSSPVATEILPKILSASFMAGNTLFSVQQLENGKFYLRAFKPDAHERNINRQKFWEIELNKTITIGRDTFTDLKDPHLGERHFSILISTLKGKTYLFLRDLGSGRGTFYPKKSFKPVNAHSLGLPSKEKVRAKIESLKDLKQKIETNTLPELVYFGDKHGEVADLEEIVAIAKRARSRGTKLHIIGHGDAFDRGSNNVGVWRIFRELQKMSEKNPNIRVTFILGNHEVALIRDQLFPYDGNERLKWRGGMGGDALVREFKKKFSSDESIEKLKELALWMLEHVKLYEIDEAGILHVHAGIPVNKLGMPAITLEDLKNWQSDLEIFQKELRARAFTEKESWLASRGAEGLMQAEGLLELFTEFSRVINVRPQKWVDLLSKEETLNFLTELGVNGIVVGHQRSDTLRQHGNWIFLIDAGISGINEHFLTLTPEGLVWYFLGVPIQKVYERHHLLTLITDEITWLQLMEAKSLGDDRLRALERAAQARPDDAAAHATYLGELIRIGRRSEVPEYFIRNNLRSFRHPTLETYFKESIPYAARGTAVADNRGIQFERSLDLPVPQSFSQSSFHADNFVLDLNGDTAILGQNGVPVSYAFDLKSGVRSEIALPNTSSLYSPDARRAVVFNRNESNSAISLFDLENKRELGPLVEGMGPQYEIQRRKPVCLSDNGFFAAVRVKEGEKQYIHVFDTKSGTQVSRTEINSRHNEQVPFALSSDGTLLVTISANEKHPSWSLYDLSSGTWINYGNHSLRDAVFSPDGKKLAITWNSQLTARAAGEESTAHLYMYSTDEKDPLYSVQMWASDIQFTADGSKFLTVNGGDGVSEAILFDAETGNRIRGFSHRSPNISGARTSRALLHPSEKYVITGGNDGYLRVWDIETGQKVNTIALQSVERATRLYMNPTGTRLLASGPRRGEGRRGTGIDVFRILKNSELPEPKRKRVGRNSKAASLGDDDLRAANQLTRHDDGFIDLLAQLAKLKREDWYEADLLDLRRKIMHEMGTSEMLPNVRRQFLDYLSAINRKLEETDGMGTRPMLPVIIHSVGNHPVTDFIFSPDGSRLIMASRSHWRLWDVDEEMYIGEPKEIWGLRLEQNFRLSDHVGFSPDGSRIISRQRGYDLHLWDAVSGRSINGNLVDHPPQFTNAEWEKFRLADLFCQDGSRFITHEEDGRYWLRSSLKGTILCSSIRARRVMLSSDGRRLISRHQPTGKPLRTFKLWDAKNPKKLIPLAEIEGENAQLMPDGKSFAVWTDKLTRMFDLEEGAEKFSVKERFYQASPDGKRILTEKTNSLLIQLRDASTGKKVGKSFAALWAVFSSGGGCVEIAKASTLQNIINAEDGEVLIEDVNFVSIPVDEYAFLETGALGHCLFNLKTKTVVSAWAGAAGQFTPAGTRLFYGQSAFPTESARIVIRNVLDNKVAHQISLSGITPRFLVGDPRFESSPDGSVLAMLEPNQSLTIWRNQPVNAASLGRSDEQGNEDRRLRELETVANSNPDDLIAQLALLTARNRKNDWRRDELLTILRRIRGNPNWKKFIDKPQTKNLLEHAFGRLLTDPDAANWDTKTRKALVDVFAYVFEPDPAREFGVSSSPIDISASQIAAGGSQGRLFLWTLSTGNLRIIEIEDHSDIRVTLFNRDRDRLAIGTEAGGVFMLPRLRSQPIFAAGRDRSGSIRSINYDESSFLSVSDDNTIDRILEVPPRLVRFKVCESTKPVAYAIEFSAPVRDLQSDGYILIIFQDQSWQVRHWIRIRHSLVYEDDGKTDWREFLRFIRMMQQNMASAERMRRIVPKKFGRPGMAKIFGVQDPAEGQSLGSKKPASNETLAAEVDRILAELAKIGAGAKHVLDYLRWHRQKNLLNVEDAGMLEKSHAIFRESLIRKHPDFVNMLRAMIDHLRKKEQLGAAEDLSLTNVQVDRAKILAKINNRPGLPVFRFVKDKSGTVTIDANPEFFDPTITDIYIRAYLKALRKLAAEDPQMASFMANKAVAPKYFDYFALSDFKQFVTSFYHQRGLFTKEELALRSFEFVRDYLKHASAQDRQALSKTRKFALADKKVRADFRRPFLISKYTPSRIVSLGEATAADWKDPNVMILDDTAYRVPEWRAVPGKEDEKYPGEIVVLAHWKKMFFFLYVSRSHTALKSPVHQWRSSEIFVGGSKFMKNEISQNLDDVLGQLSTMLDQAIYDRKLVRFEGPEKFDEFRSGYLNINAALSGDIEYPKFKAARLKASSLGSREEEAIQSFIEAMEKNPQNVSGILAAIRVLKSSKLPEEKAAGYWEKVVAMAIKCIFTFPPEDQNLVFRTLMDKKELLLAGAANHFTDYFDTLEFRLTPFRERKSLILREKITLFSIMNTLIERVNRLFELYEPYETDVAALPEFEKFEAAVEEGKRILGDFSANSLGTREKAIRLLAGKSVPDAPKEVQQLLDEAGVITDEQVKKAEKASRSIVSSGTAALPVTEANNVVLALHIDSLPDEVSPEMIQILSQVKKLILVFPQGDDKGERIYESLGPKKAARFSYVGDIPVRDIQRELEKERGTAKGFLTQNLDLVSGRLKNTREKISYFELDGRQYQKKLAENALTLILNLIQNPESIHEWQGVAKAASLGNGAIGISFDLGALVERLTVINDSGKSLARAA